MTDPTTSRPYMPGYPLLAPDEGTGLLPWSWALEHLAASHDFWVATVSPAGTPCVTPTWGVLLHDEVWFSCAPASRKARNLAANPRVTITTDRPQEPVIVEGEARRVTERPDIERFAAAMNGAYEYQSPVEFFLSNATFRVRPVVAFGMIEEDFGGSPTRWTFPPR